MVAYADQVDCSRSSGLYGQGHEDVAEEGMTISCNGLGSCSASGARRRSACASVPMPCTTQEHKSSGEIEHVGLYEGFAPAPDHGRCLLATWVHISSALDTSGGIVSEQSH